MKKWRLNSNKHRPKFKQEHKKTKSNLSSNLQFFNRLNEKYYREAALLNIYSFLLYKRA